MAYVVEHVSAEKLWISWGTDFYSEVLVSANNSLNKTLH